jgi:hypothetical protein
MTIWYILWVFALFKDKFVVLFPTIWVYKLSQEESGNPVLEAKTVDLKLTRGFFYHCSIRQSKIPFPAKCWEAKI